MIIFLFLQYRLKQQLVDMKLKPQQLEMERTLMILQERDTTNIFSEPVKPEEVRLSCPIILSIYPVSLSIMTSLSHVCLDEPRSKNKNTYVL